MRRHRWCTFAIALGLTVSGCDRSASDPAPFEADSSRVTIRDSAGIRIVENHAPVWDSAAFWTVDSEPRFVLDGLGTPGDSAHLIWNITAVVPLSDGRVATLTPMADRKVLVFEPSSRLSAAFGRTGRGPGEFRYPLHIQVLPGDTISVWDQMFGPVYYFDPSGRLLRERRIDLGAVVAATQTSSQRPGESVHSPLPDGSFLIEVKPADWRPPTKSGVIYRRPRGYVRIDATYSAHSFGWWRGREQLSRQRFDDAGHVPFPAGSMTAAGGDPLVVYITNSDRYEVHQFSATGALQRILRRTITPAPIDDEQTETWKGFVAPLNPQVNWRRWERTMSELPERDHPAIGNLRVDSEGYLWVKRPGREHSWGEWNVFNPEGRWLGTLEVPMLAVYWIGEDFILGGHMHVDTGVEVVMLYRLNRHREP